MTNCEKEIAAFGHQAAAIIKFAMERGKPIKGIELNFMQRNKADIVNHVDLEVSYCDLNVERWALRACYRPFNDITIRNTELSDSNKSEYFLFMRFNGETPTAAYIIDNTGMLKWLRSLSGDELMKYIVKGHSFFAINTSVLKDFIIWENIPLCA